MRRRDVPVVKRAAKPKIRLYQTRVVPIDSLAPHPRNTEYHSHPDAQVEILAESAQAFGQYKNIVVWKKKIIAGAGIWAGLKKAGASQVEIKDVSHLTPGQALSLMTADNETQKGAVTNDAALAAIVKEVMDAEGAAMARLAAGEQKALDALLAQANRKEETADVGAQLGQMEYRVIITCHSEQHQTELLERFEAEGLQCQALIS